LRSSSFARRCESNTVSAPWTITAPAGEIRSNARCQRRSSEQTRTANAMLDLHGRTSKLTARAFIWVLQLGACIADLASESPDWRSLELFWVRTHGLLVDLLPRWEKAQEQVDAAGASAAALAVMRFVQLKALPSSAQSPPSITGSDVLNAPRFANVGFTCARPSTSSPAGLLSCSVRRNCWSTPSSVRTNAAPSRAAATVPL
jgi:hypothetical protein